MTKVGGYAVIYNAVFPYCCVTGVICVKKYLALGPVAASGSSLQECTLTPQSVHLYTAWWCLYCSPPAQTQPEPFTHLYNIYKEDKTIYTSINFCTFGCRAYHSSIWESNSQESKVSSTSPRKLLCPNRSWCQTDTCKVRVSSCEWLITYCVIRKKNKRLMSDIQFLCVQEMDDKTLYRMTNPQILIKDRVNGVGLDRRLPLALPWHIWEQVRLHITVTKKAR